MSDVGTITKIKGNRAIQEAVDKLLAEQTLSLRESELVLAAAVLLLRHSEASGERGRGFEFAYWIVLNYSLETGNLKPLYDIAFSMGLYPICKAIARTGGFDSLGDGLALSVIDSEFTRDVVLTFEQDSCDRRFDAAGERDVAYLAPTSFGKTTRMIAAALSPSSGDRPCIVVPTKSLLAQTREDVLASGAAVKVITHDEMYAGERRFVGVMTQERAIRLLEGSREVTFTHLFVDEAHNLFGEGERPALLTRLVREGRKKEPSMGVTFLSPVVGDASLFSKLTGDPVEEIRVRVNMKEPRYYLLDRRLELSSYNRFFNTYVDVGAYSSMWDCVDGLAEGKSLVFLGTPRKIREAALSLAAHLPQARPSKGLSDVIEALSAHVGEEYDEIECLRHGVVYLHGKMPDGIKDYLVSKASELPEVRYVVANSVILEGMNLHIDSIFILNSYRLSHASLVNLIGRASRLNAVFGDEPSLGKLRPKVVFVDSEWNPRNWKMKKLLEKLHKAAFTDEVKNPRIKAGRGEDLPQDERAALEFEEGLEESACEPDSDLRLLLDRSGLRSVYSDWDAARAVIEGRLVGAEHRESVGLLELVCMVFVDGLEGLVSDKQTARLRSAIGYYSRYLTDKGALPLSQRIAKNIGVSKKRAAEGMPYVYVGTSFGEVDLNGQQMSQAAYFDITEKSPRDLPALFLAKFKTEDDFLSYDMGRFVRVLHKCSLVSDAEYNRYMYGTDDEGDVELIRMGVPLSLIGLLREKGQLEHVTRDRFGNLVADRELVEFSQTVDDYARFQIGRFAYGESI